MDIKLLTENAKKPHRATKNSLGFDLIYPYSDIVIPSGKMQQVPMGVALDLESQKLVAFIFIRSGIAKNHGITLLNNVGLIDADYQGELKILLLNVSEQDYLLKQGTRIAQIVFIPPMFLKVANQVETEGFNIVSDFKQKTQRGIGGFGSTGEN